MILTREFLDTHRTPAGDWTARQLAALGLPCPPPLGWKRQAIGKVLTALQIAEFTAKPLSNAERRKELSLARKEARSLAARLSLEFGIHLDKLLHQIESEIGLAMPLRWADRLRPLLIYAEKYAPLHPGRQKAAERIAKRTSRKPTNFKSTFYNTKEWREVRYKALELGKGRCECCKSSDKPLHVDHIKPRSKYPHLELKLSNLQVLCVDCNLGKSNKYETDWRMTNIP